MTRRVNLQPSWAQTAQLLLVLLQDGNAEGQEFARSEILRMGKIIDHLQKGEKK